MTNANNLTHHGERMNRRRKSFQMAWGRKCSAKASTMTMHQVLRT